MRHNEYTVTFVTGQVEVVYTFGSEAAGILAQAMQITKGNDYTIKSIELTTILK